MNETRPAATPSSAGQKPRTCAAFRDRLEEARDRFRDAITNHRVACLAPALATAWLARAEEDVSTGTWRTMRHDSAVVGQFENSHPTSGPNMIAATIAATHAHDIGSGSTLGGLLDSLPLIGDDLDVITPTVADV
jgi:hypothetical protein